MGSDGVQIVATVGSDGVQGVHSAHPLAFAGGAKRTEHLNPMIT